MNLFPSKFGTRIAGSILLFSALFIGTVAFRLAVEGKTHLKTGMELRDRGDHSRAVAAFEDASRAYLPASPYHVRAHRELELLARGAVMRGDTGEAAYIYEVVRRSILSTRHFWQPNKEALSRAERGIARLQSRSIPELSATGGPLERPPDPSPILSLLLILGFLLWIGGGATLCLGPSKKHSHRFKWALVATGGGLGLWLVMAWLAG